MSPCPFGYTEGARCGEREGKRQRQREGERERQREREREYMPSSLNKGPLSSPQTITSLLTRQPTICFSLELPRDMS